MKPTVTNGTTKNPSPLETIGEKRGIGKKMRTRTKFVLIAMFNITWYTIVVLYLSYKDHTVPSELTVAWFAAWVSELALLAGIKIRGKENDGA